MPLSCFDDDYDAATRPTAAPVFHHAATYFARWRENGIEGWHCHRYDAAASRRHTRLYVLFRHAACAFSRAPQARPPGFTTFLKWHGCYITTLQSVDNVSQSLLMTFFLGAIMPIPLAFRAMMVRCTQWHAAAARPLYYFAISPPRSVSSPPQRREDAGRRHLSMRRHAMATDRMSPPPTTRSRARQSLLSTPCRSARPAFSSPRARAAMMMVSRAS